MKKVLLVVGFVFLVSGCMEGSNPKMKKILTQLDEKKIEEKKLDFKEEYNKKITFEKNSQLDTFSKIYYKKIKKNSVISEY